MFASDIVAHGALGAGQGWAHPEVRLLCEASARPGYDSSRAHEFKEAPGVFDLKIEVLCDLLKRSRSTQAYTGAGISTASGLGDYATQSPDSVTAQGRPQLRTHFEAQPTAAHHALVALHESGLLHGWIQQNHDGLPQKAGYPQGSLNEIHGSWFDPSNPVVSMSGQLRSDLFEDMQRRIQAADLVLALGTSLAGMNADQCVTSVAERARSHGALGAVIVSLQQTQQDGIAALRIFAPIDEMMEAVCGRLGLVPRRSPAPGLNPVEEVFQVAYGEDGARLSEGRTRALDLREDAQVRVVAGPYAGCEGEVVGQQKEGHVKLRIMVPVKKLRAPHVVVLGGWWVQDALAGTAAAIPVVSIL